MTGHAARNEEQAAIEKLCAQLIRLADLPEENEETAEVRRWVKAQVSGLAEHRLGELPFTSIAAHVLNSVGKVNEAFVLAEASVRRRGLDELCVLVINRVREAVLRGAFDALFAKRPDMARANLSFMLDRLGDVLDLIDEHALVDLLSHIDTIDARRAGVQPLEGRPSVLKIAVWGESFLDSAERNVFASCIAPGNVPTLARFGPVIVHIHTRERDVNRVRALPAVQELGRHAEIKFEIIPEKLFIPSHMWELAFWYRNILAMAEYDSLMYARQIGADMFCLGADMVVSDGYLRAVKEKLASGHDIVMMSTLRVLDDRMSAALDQYRQGPTLAVPAEALYRASLETLHPAMLQQFMRDPPQRLPADPHQFFFTRPEGFSVHAFQWHPFGFSTRSVPETIGFDGQTIDCRFPSDLLVEKDRPSACYLEKRPPENGYMVSLDKAHGIARFGNFEVSPAGVARSLEKWINRDEDFDHFEWILRQSALYRVPPGVRLPLPGDCRDEEDSIDEVVRCIEGMRPAISQRIARYR